MHISAGDWTMKRFFPYMDNIYSRNLYLTNNRLKMRLC